MVKTINHFFPHLSTTICSSVKDLRDARGKRYPMADAILSVLVMFLLKEGSRNNYNQDGKNPSSAEISVGY